MAREVLQVPLGDIKVEGRFREDLGDIEELAQSIKEKGLIQPITVNQDMKLLAGGRRYAAHELLEISIIDVIVRKGNDHIDALEIELAENVMRKDMTWQEVCKLEKRIYDEMAKKGSWSERRQAEMLDSSKSQTHRNIKMAEALEMIPDLSQHKSFSDAWKEYKKLEEDVVVGMLRQKVPESVKQAAKWAEDHYIVGDAFRGMEEQSAKTVDFAEVDPPYGVDLHIRKGRNTNHGNMDEYNEIDEDEYVEFYRKVAAEVHRVLKDNSFAVFWYGMSWHQEVLDVLREVGFSVPDIPAVWTKGAVGQTASPDTTLGSCYEPFFLARKGKPVLRKPGRGNVFDFKPVSPSKKIHGTERPIELMEELLNVVLTPGSSIMVPFLGSGVTLRAAYRAGHTGFGWDLSEVHKNRFLKKVSDDAEEDDSE